MQHYFSALPDNIDKVEVQTEEPDTTTTIERSSKHTVELGRLFVVAVSIVCTTIIAIKKPDALAVFVTIPVACVSGYFGVAQQPRTK